MDKQHFWVLSNWPEHKYSDSVVSGQSQSSMTTGEGYNNTALYPSPQHGSIFSL